MADDADKANSGERLQFRLRRVVLRPDVSPRTVHKVLVNIVGDECLVETGYMDFMELRATLERFKSGEAEAASEVDFFVTDQFSLGREGVESFLAAADLMRKHLGRRLRKKKKE